MQHLERICAVSVNSGPKEMACWHFERNLNKRDSLIIHVDEAYGVVAPPLASEILVRLPIISFAEVMVEQRSPSIFEIICINQVIE